MRTISELRKSICIEAHTAKEACDAMCKAIEDSWSEKSILDYFETVRKRYKEYRSNIESLASRYGYTVEWNEFGDFHLKKDKPPQTISRPCLCCDAICSPADSKMFAPASRCPLFHRAEKGQD